MKLIFANDDDDDDDKQENRMQIEIRYKLKLCCPVFQKRFDFKMNDVLKMFVAFSVSWRSVFRRLHSLFDHTVQQWFRKVSRKIICVIGAWNYVARHSVSNNDILGEKKQRRKRARKKTGKFVVDVCSVKPHNPHPNRFFANTKILRHSSNAFPVFSHFPHTFPYILPWEANLYLYGHRRASERAIHSTQHGYYTALCACVFENVLWNCELFHQTALYNFQWRVCVCVEKLAHRHLSHHFLTLWFDSAFSQRRQRRRFVFVPLSNWTYQLEFSCALSLSFSLSHSFSLPLCIAPVMIIYVREILKNIFVGVVVHFGRKKQVALHFQAVHCDAYFVVNLIINDKLFVLVNILIAWFMLTGALIVLCRAGFNKRHTTSTCFFFSFSVWYLLFALRVFGFWFFRRFLS